MPTKIVAENLDERIIKITLSDPETGNALGIETAREFDSHIKKLSAPKSKKNLLLLTGTSRFFCTGGNLKNYRNLNSKASGIKLNREIASILKRFHELKMVKVAMLTGDCFGGGIELLSCCDFAFATPEVLFGFWQSKQALLCGWGGTSRLAERISLNQLKRSLLRSEVLSAYEAARLNLIDQVLSRTEIETYVLNFSKQISLHSRALNSSIQILNEKNESSQFGKLWWSEEHLKRLRSR